MTNALSRTRRNHELWDQRVNDLWAGHKPVLSPEDTVAAARKLYRHAMGKPWPGKWVVTSGRRHTWPNRGTFYVNPNRYGGGLRQVVHLISHWCHRRLHPGDKPHSIRQLRLEAKLTRFAVARWGKNAVTPEPKAAAPAAATEVKAKPDKVVQRYRRMITRRDRWADQLARAKRLAAKAEAEVRAYERRHGQRLNG
jgi:hypothetical protein